MGDLSEIAVDDSLMMRRRDARADVFEPDRGVLRRNPPALLVCMWSIFAKYCRELSNQIDGTKSMLKHRIETAATEPFGPGSGTDSYCLRVVRTSATLVNRFSAEPGAYPADFEW